MAHAHTDILAFVEDPGAANFVAPLLPELASAGCTVSMVATAAGADQLARLGVGAAQLDGTLEAEDLLRRWRPRLVLIGTSENPDTLGLKLVLAARHSGITSVGAVDGPANADWRFRGPGESPLTCAPDWILVADERTRAAFVSMGQPQENVLVVGHPHYDRVWERRDQMESIGRQTIRSRIFPDAGMLRIVTFVAEISDGLNPSQYSRSPDYTLNGRGTSLRRTDIVLEEVLDALVLVSPRPYFVLRLHPKNAPGDFDVYRSEIDFLSQKEEALEIAYASDLVVGMSSQLLLEAAILGRPTLAVLPRPEERAWLSTIATGRTVCATSRSSLRGVLGGLCNSEDVSVNADIFDGPYARGAARCASQLLANLATGTPAARGRTGARRS